jgi:hypothetical protein
MMLSAAESTALADTTSSWAADSLRARVASAAWLAREGDGRGQVLEPAGVAVDAFGRAYVSDAALHRLQRFDPEGRYLGESGVLGSEEGEMRRPGSVVLLGVLGWACSIARIAASNPLDLFRRRVGTTLVWPIRRSRRRSDGSIRPGARLRRGAPLYVADPA